MTYVHNILYSSMPIYRHDSKALFWFFIYFFINIYISTSGILVACCFSCAQSHPSLSLPMSLFLSLWCLELCLETLLMLTLTLLPAPTLLMWETWMNLKDWSQRAAGMSIWPPLYPPSSIILLRQGNHRHQRGGEAGGGRGVAVVEAALYTHSSS